MWLDNIKERTLLSVYDLLRTGPKRGERRLCTPMTILMKVGMMMNDIQ